MDDKAGKGKTSSNRGKDFHSRSELGQVIECHEKDLEIAIEIGDRAVSYTHLTLPTKLEV